MAQGLILIYLLFGAAALAALPCLHTEAQPPAPVCALSLDPAPPHAPPQTCMAPRSPTPL